MSVVLPNELANSILMRQYQSKMWLINRHFYDVWKKVLHDYRQTTIPPSIKTHKYGQVACMHYKKHTCGSSLFECTIFTLALVNNKPYVHIIRQYRGTKDGGFKAAGMREHRISYPLT